MSARNDYLYRWGEDPISTMGEMCDEIDRLRAGLSEALDLVDALLDQQAMPDDFWITPYHRLREML